MNTKPEAPYSIYGIDKWGKNLLEVTPNGELALKIPFKDTVPSIPLPSIIRDLRERGIRLPVLLRIATYLRNEIVQINESFAKAIKQYNYKSKYLGVFPIKVNQQAQIINRIVSFGSPYNFGLEAGSKAELVIALAHNLSKDALLICNGVKDKKFIRLAIMARQIGFNTIIVLESPKETEMVIEVTKELGIEPVLGVRVKLTQEISGKWQKSSGDRSTFGLSTHQLLSTVERLREVNLLHTLKLQHSHLGSQVPDVNDLRRATDESCRYFVELVREGVNLEYLDIGGGLGVDYTGEKCASDHSINYTVNEYCENIVETIAYAMDAAKIAHPILVTESGRAVVASSSILVFDVIDSTLYDSQDMPVAEEGDHHYISDMINIQNYITPRRLQECWNDATFYRNELRAIFHRGYVNIKQMARGEQIYLSLISQFKKVIVDQKIEGDLEKRIDSIADIYQCNFSLFQSLPDVWAIDQVHPIIPLQMLDQLPDRRAILSDITCDSDGRLDKFFIADGLTSTLPIHSLPEDQDYYLSVFFVGAYQETLGDLHNLFGDTDVVTIELCEDGSFDLLHEQEGDTVSEVLSYVEYDPSDCIASFRKMVDEQISNKNLKAHDRKTIMNQYRNNITGYTYYE